MKDISSTNYKAYEEAFDVLNERLFDGTLPAVVLTLRAGRNTNGYAWAKRFKLHDPSGEVVNVVEDNENADESNRLFDEIAINPATASRPARDVLGTLLHEMCHIWQFNFGKPSRNSYHNAQWAAKMLEVGLKPFNVKNPEAMTGQSCSHTIEDDGLADLVFQEIEEAFGADLVIELPAGEKKKTAKNSKVKFTCPGCGANAWGKASLKVACGECNSEVGRGDFDMELTLMVSEESDDDNTEGEEQ